MPTPKNKWCPYYCSLGIYLLFIVFAFIAQPPKDVFVGLARILTSRSLLSTDYIAVGGLGAALLNAALSGILSVLALRAAKIAPNGALLMAIGLTTGFSFWGKNIFNIIPLTLGVWLYSRYQREPFSTYSLTALLSSTLAPVVSEFAFMGRFPPLLELCLGVLAGVAVGFVMPVITSAVTRVHSGYNLYNAGFAGGVVAIFIVGICAVLRLDIQRGDLYSSGNNLLLAVFLYLTMAAWIVIGLLWPGRENLAKNGKKLLAHSGRLVTDYYLLYGGAAFINMGLLGILTTSIVLLLGGQLAGGTLAGIFCVTAFGAFGMHLRNTAPVLAGAILMALLNRAAPSDPANLCSILFSTGLAPIAGQYGWGWGVVAGALHLIISAQIGEVTGGLNLYNNGFAAGFVALVLVPLILSFKRGKNIRENEV